MANESQDQPVLSHIDALVKEEERLFSQAELSDSARLAKSKVDLDQRPIDVPVFGKVFLVKLGWCLSGTCICELYHHRLISD